MPRDTSISTARPSYGKISPTVLFKLLKTLRWESSWVIRRLFPEDLALFAMPGLPVSTISKWRNGHDTSAMFRLDRALVAAWMAGAPEENAQQVADHVQELVYRLYRTPADDEILGIGCVREPSAA